MLTRQRKQLILQRLKQDGQIVAATLSVELGLSEDTIRRDLRSLAAEGLLQRVHGGALPSSQALGNFAMRTQVEPEGKRAIGRAAAALVRPGQVVFLDGGTSCEQLALQLPASLAATVVTHSPTIAVALVAHPHIEVVLIGGRLFKHSVVAVGAAALQAIRLIHADLFFMGVTGAHPQTGLTTGDLEEAHIKRALMSQAAETWVLASSEKLNAASSCVIAPCQAATGLIVERSVPKRQTSAFEDLGLSVLRA
ncbi:MAG: DeoR/GlpR transcriptional regulator [Cytophagales bacterium]|nr:DeoR/GlpR transcriptional regulator [Rhizobacter sp.]